MSLRVHPKSGRRLSSLLEWQRFVDEFSQGNHLLAWTSTEPFLRDLAERFLGQGLERDERAFLLLPLGDLGVLRHFTWRGQGFSALVGSGRMRVVPSEDVLPRLDGSSEGRKEGVRQLLGSLIREAFEGGHSGARILGRVAPLFFERAQDDAAVEIEEAVRPFRSSCTVLCLYRTAALQDPRRFDAAVRLRRTHTHSLLEVPDGAVVCDPPPSDRPREGGG